MRLFEIQPGEVPNEDYSIWHLDLDHVVCIKEGRRSDRSIYWFVEMSNRMNFSVTKALFDRIMRAWESK
jgi:hypothetical protein